MICCVIVNKNNSFEKPYILQYHLAANLNILRMMLMSHPTSRKPLPDSGNKTLYRGRKFINFLLMWFLFMVNDNT